MFLPAQIVLRICGHTLTVTSPRWALRKSSIKVRDCPIPPPAGEVSLKLDDPLLIYSRLDLNRLLLDRAARAGAQIEKARVLEIARAGEGWNLRTTGGVAPADFCIVATGARNPLRNVGTELHSDDAMSALGYYVPGDQNRIDI